MVWFIWRVPVSRQDTTVFFFSHVLFLEYRSCLANSILNNKKGVFFVGLLV